MIAGQPILFLFVPTTGWHFAGVWNPTRTSCPLVEGVELMDWAASVIQISMGSQWDALRFQQMSSWTFYKSLGWWGWVCVVERQHEISSVWNNILRLWTNDRISGHVLVFHSKVLDNKARFVVNTSTECKRLAGSCSSNQVQKIDKVSVTGNEPFVKRQIGVPCWCLGRSHIISGRDSSFLETYFGSLALSCNGIYQQRISEILEDVTLVGF